VWCASWWGSSSAFDDLVDDSYPPVSFEIVNATPPPFKPEPEVQERVEPNEYLGFVSVTTAQRHCRRLCVPIVCRRHR
jgi:hypothetical protein